MKVLITSKTFSRVSDKPVNLLQEQGISWERLGEPFCEEEFVKKLIDCDALIIGSHPITYENMVEAKKLKLICKHGTGLDNIDILGAKELGITVTNVPAMNANAVADMTLGLMLDVARKITYGANQLKSGNAKPIMGVDVFEKTLGLVGFGAISKRVAKRAHGFSMKVFAYDPYVSEVPEDIAFVKLVSLTEVIEKADFLSLHLPITEDTRNIIDTEQLNIMKKGSVIINTARGGLINEEALFNALKKGHLGGAGLDVMEVEPAIDSPLLELENVVVLPHMAMASREATDMISMVCAKNVVALVNNEPVMYQV